MLSARNYGYFISLVPASITLYGNFQGGWWALSNYLFSFLVLGAVEHFTGTITSNKHSHSKDMLPKAILLLHVIFHAAVVCSFFYSIETGLLKGPFIYLAALSVGAVSGSGAIIVAHEFIHKSTFWEKRLGEFLLFLSGNFYFKIHHLRIHHKLVGQSDDAATARRGESIYRFYNRTLYGQIAQAWNSEKERLKKTGVSPWSFKNEMFRLIIAQLLWLSAIGFLFGFTALSAWLLVIYLANLLLEYVNYIEHYGLVRNSGERVNHTHSWNCDKVISRFFLVDLSRHSDHHFHASKPYHTLDSHKQSPVLPGGYASLIIPALIPKWWFSIVHPRLDSYKKGQ